MAFEDGADGEGYCLVANEVGLDEDGVGAEALCGDCGESGADSVATGFVGCGADDRSLALLGDNNGLAAQGGVVSLFNRGVEGVHIDVNDLAQLNGAGEGVCRG